MGPVLKGPSLFASIHEAGAWTVCGANSAIVSQACSAVSHQSVGASSCE